MRFEERNVCAALGACKRGERCQEARMPPRAYDGLRLTSDGFDCALPVSIDSHSVCSYGCLYCFSDNTIGHRAGRARNIGQTSLSRLERLFAGAGGKELDLYRKALKYDRRNKDGYPCPVQLGAINDPCDHIERQQGWLLDFIKLAIKYRQPVRISTKGTVFLLQDYIGAIQEAPELFWVAFSIISPDDELLEKIDRQAPPPSYRIKTMSLLSKIGVRTSLRFRPMFPGLSDSTKNYPRAYKTLIDMAAEAGACAISCEVGFVPGSLTTDLKWRWEQFGKAMGISWVDIYRKFGPTMACMRPPNAWTENIMHAVKEVAHNNGMVVGVSDPVWKQLTDTGCCCGILPDDPVFGNWQEESATNQFLLAMRTGKELGIDDITPGWAHEARLAGIVYPGVGPTSAWEQRHGTWGTYLEKIWNNVGAQRGPLNYFQGALQPTRTDEMGNVFYRYVGLERTYPEQDFLWRVLPLD